ncbi:UspA domain protein [Pseudogulbenkiania sp. NH8B]|uniref:universal stress protein n=1 Tax=Pseudogulbenkiania sp. (strain NH8B) TaxID=748280 RepID=UPI0002279A33|nr:universal stress protein [Pseudogulbenkiania sp. NH8B]BAK76817.1 UspA domain protein [Pseudogulbenkiania sp. NH8B]
MYRHLLVPIDDTDRSTETVGQSVAFAHALGARITFFHAQPDHASSLFGSTEVIRLVAPAEFTYVCEARTHELLAKAESAARAQGVTCDSASRVSDTPHQAILAAARQTGCDLIFIGSQGKRGDTGMMLGSQTLKLLMHSDIPVLVAANSSPSMAAQAMAVIRDEHRSIAAVLHAWQYLIQQAEEHGQAIDLGLMQAILRYLHRFPVALHHPKEDDYLFSKLRQRTSAINAELDELERQHGRDRQLVAELAIMLEQLAAGSASLAQLKQHVDQYAKFIWDHLGREEGVILPAAQRYLTETDWHDINAAFAGNDDPRFGGASDSEFKQLFNRIVDLANSKEPSRTLAQKR